MNVLYLSVSLLPLLSDSNLKAGQNKLGHQRTLLAIDLVSVEMHEFECCIIKINALQTLKDLCVHDSCM